MASLGLKEVCAAGVREGQGLEFHAREGRGAPEGGSGSRPGGAVWSASTDTLGFAVHTLNWPLVRRGGCEAALMERWPS